MTLVKSTIKKVRGTCPESSSLIPPDSIIPLFIIGGRSEEPTISKPQITKIHDIRFRRAKKILGLSRLQVMSYYDTFLREVFRVILGCSRCRWLSSRIRNALVKDMCERMVSCSQLNLLLFLMFAT